MAGSVVVVMAGWATILLGNRGTIKVVDILINLFQAQSRMSASLHHHVERKLIIFATLKLEKNVSTGMG